MMDYSNMSGDDLANEISMMASEMQIRIFDMSLKNKIAINRCQEIIADSDGYEDRAIYIQNALEGK